MPADPKTNTEPYENTTRSDRPAPPERDRRPETQYPDFERKDSTNRTDADAPGGPVNIPVKGGADAAGPDDAARPAPARGSREAPGSRPEE